VAVQNRHIIGDSELIDLIEPDGSSAQGPLKAQACPAKMPSRRRNACRDVYEVGVISEQ
jgi:hypothetical protein